MKLAAFTVALLGGALAACAQPIRVIEIDRTIDGAQVRGFAAWIDLRDPDVEIVVTSPEPMPDGAPERSEARLVATDAWAEREGVALAINASYFGVTGPGYADVVGLAVSDTKPLSPVRTHEGVPDPVLLFTTDGRARIERAAPADLTRIQDAVAGVGGSNTSDLPGTLLIDNGRNLGATARVAPAARHPRTAAGVSRDGRALLLVAIDGRQPGHSAGITLPALATLMLELGAWDALNLDGGGSTAFISRLNRSEAQGPQTNRPSDGAFRPVAVHLGVRIRP
ncbi:MAG: phosphodiester glycosidase family protein [Planctomycetota bacterium]